MSDQIISDTISRLLQNDPFSQWMGLNLHHADRGKCICSITITDTMANGYSITHGGILFSLADTALAFAAATHGEMAVTVEHSISYLKKTKPGDTLTATAVCQNMDNKNGVVIVEIRNSAQDLVALSKGSVYRTGKPLTNS